MTLKFEVTPLDEKSAYYLGMLLEKLDRHEAGRSGGPSFPCTICGQIWPCDALKAKAIIDGTGMIG